MKDTDVNKKNRNILVLLAASLILLLFILAVSYYSGQGSSLYDDPESMADGALACIHGWKDIEMLMSLTPYQEGSEIYYEAYYHFEEMMQNSGRISNYHDIDSVNLQKADRSYYNEIIRTLNECRITGVKSIKRFTYQYNGNYRIDIYVAQIGGEWYTIYAE